MVVTYQEEQLEQGEGEEEEAQSLRPAGGCPERPRAGRQPGHVAKPREDLAAEVQRPRWEER